MPNWTYHYAIGTSASSDVFWTSSTPLTATQVQQQYEEWKQECERQDHMIEQIWREEQERIDKMDELRKDKEKYPLFFLEEGIV